MKRIRTGWEKAQAKRRYQRRKTQETAYREAERQAFYSGDTTFYQRVGRNPYRVHFLPPDPAQEAEKARRTAQARLEAAEREYRRLAFQCHPDLNGGDGERMRKLNDWIDEERRKFAALAAKAR